jgi:hypothetical protein
MLLEMLLTESFMVIFLILQGFIEIITIRLPQNKRQRKHIAIESE